LTRRRSNQHTSYGTHSTIPRDEHPKDVQSLCALNSVPQGPGSTVTKAATVRLCRFNGVSNAEFGRSIAGTSESNYLAWCKAKHLTPRTVNLTDIDTKAFWLGDADAENVVIYFHGGKSTQTEQTVLNPGTKWLLLSGGYAMPASDGHFVFLTSLLTKAGAAGKSVAVLVLQYDLAPGGRYPRQLIQAVELLRHTTTTLGKSPSHIMLMGDSAGGNLIFGVLSHLMHPHPSIQPLKLAEPLRGALLSSPVCALNTDNPKFRTQEVQDPASAGTIRVWLKNLLGSSKPDAWNEPLNADVSWWKDLPKVVDKVLVTVASKEMMAGDTCECADKIRGV